ncbi:hypothetical protein [Streptomyces luteogriseus]|uniref:hypothetical protein n=1 Tax=Streptomyces luteogriseus TaxID=68233 RepID=UPI00370FB78D
MGWFDKVLGDDHERAEKYAGRESATDRAARKRREGHRRNLGRAAAEGQAWEDRDRQQDRKGRWYRAAR